ncbi:MAG: 3-oxoacyl-ACP reductase FabG [Syntrophorhabdus sp.]|jgi:3-oxoacyl-[acyl-carrier protein] reductase|nr:3-oxoacyl-ACP reductase FabG [Syntrophorhabdus sp.]
MGSRPIALVTGGSKGIGAAIAVTLARDGFDIWLNYRTDHDGARSVAEKVSEQGGGCRLLCFDVAEAAGVAVALEPLLEKEIPYALINNAGLNKDALLAWMTNAEWNDVLSTSLDGFFFVTKAVVTGMLRKRKGRIVNIVSTSGQSGVGGQVNYSAAKAGLIGATKSLAVEIARRNILVNAVSPGFIETEMTRALPREQILASIPLGRLGSPMEVAEVVSFLCSDRASYITGQVISVNGGIYR